MCHSGCSYGPTHNGAGFSRISTTRNIQQLGASASGPPCLFSGKVQTKIPRLCLLALVVQVPRVNTNDPVAKLARVPQGEKYAFGVNSALHDCEMSLEKNTTMGHNIANKPCSIFNEKRVSCENINSTRRFLQISH